MSEIESLSVDEALDVHVARHAIDRLIMLCDGVFAIAITLAAVEIHVPEGPTFSAVVSQMGVRLLAYGISFMVIAMFWASNRDLFACLRRVDRSLTALVMLLLGMVALVPAAVRITGPGEGQLGGPFQFYAAIMTVSGAINCVLWLYASTRRGLMKGEVTRAYRHRRVIETATLPLLFGTLFLLPTVDTLRWIGVAALVVIGARRLLIRRLTGG